MFLSITKETGVKSLQVSIKGERLRLKLTQSQLAEKIGISRRMMSYIETGERGVPPEAA